MTRAVRGQREAFKVRVVLIEDKASGTRLIHELVADGLRAVTAAEQDHVHAGQTRVRLDLVAPGRPIVFYGVLDIIKSYFSRRERRRYWGAKGHQLDFVPSRCLRTRRASARVLVYSTGGAQGLKPKERPALDRRC